MATKNADLRYAVWPTPWGPVGALHGPKGLKRLVLPHYQLDELRQLLAWEHKGATEDRAAFTDLIDRTVAYFGGEVVEFDDIECDLPRGFPGQVLLEARKIRYGETCSYGWLAKRIGREDAARPSAAALGKNTIPLVVPCHRITYSDGSAGGFSAPGGVALKQRMLDLEKRRGGKALGTRH